MLQHQCMFDPSGRCGLWDVLEADIGTRNVPTNLGIPWMVQLRNGVSFRAWPDGRVAVTTLSATVADVEALESLIKEKFAAVWTSEVEHASRKASGWIVFGDMGERAKERRHTQQVFW